MGLRRRSGALYRKRCGRCTKAKGCNEFSPGMWELRDGALELCCLECVRGERKRGFWVCTNKRCKLQKPHAEFSLVIAKYGQKVKGDSRRCDACITAREAELTNMTHKNLEHVQKRHRSTE